MDQGAVAGLGPGHVPAQADPVQDRFQGVVQQVEADNGFFQIIGRAESEGPDHAGDFVLAGDDEDRRGGFLGGQGGQYLETVEHGQTQVEEHGIGMFLADAGQSLPAVGRLQRGIAGVGQPQADAAPHVLVVLDH